MEVVPGKQLPLGQAVVNHAVVAILVLEGNGHGLQLAGCCVVHLVDGGVTGCVAGHGVKLPADHEGVGHGRLPDARLPAPLHLQTVWVQLRDHNGSLGLAGGVYGPQPLLVHRQVDVRVPAPGVGELAVEASVGEFTTGRHVLRGQVIADQGATQPSLVVQGPSVYRGPGAFQWVWQQQDLSQQNMRQ